MQTKRITYNVIRTTKKVRYEKTTRYTNTAVRDDR